MVQLVSNASLTQAEFLLALVVAIINGISIAFDGWDAYRWLHGDRKFEWPAEHAITNAATPDDSVKPSAA